MYKRIILLSLSFCTFTQYASEITPWLEVKPSYFFFVTSPMHDVYKKGGFELQGSASVPFYKCLAFYTSIGVRKVWGHALNTGEKTTLTVMPFDIGLKPIFNFSERFFYFFAIGPRFFYFHQHNDSPYVDPTINGGGVGFFVNTGFTMLVTDCFLFGIFGEYSYEKKAITPTMPNVFGNGSTQIGGLVFGINLGYAF